MILSRTALRKPITYHNIFCRAVCTSEKSEDTEFKNELPLDYCPGSPERVELEKALERMKCNCEDIPIVINGKEIRTKNIRHQFMPHSHRTNIAKFYYAEPKQIHKAAKIAADAQDKWDRTPYSDRINIWERAANLIATKYRTELVAATMLGQSKSVWEAENDAAVELIDHIRLTTHLFKQHIKYQPITADPEKVSNTVQFHGLEGFIATISPFNFTCIAGFMVYTPVLLGNAVVWRPDNGSILSNWRLFQIMREAGVPDGVVNFVPASGPDFSEVVTYSTTLAGINFTGKVEYFKNLWKLVGRYLNDYKNFPRLSAQCGGKNFHFVHETADVEVVLANTIRSAYEYGGQKNASCSRLYVPESLWNSKIKDALIEESKKLIVDDVCNFKTFYSALINHRAFLRVCDYIEFSKRCSACKILTGGIASNLKGLFVNPTIVLSTDPSNILFKDEISGPLLSVFVYKNNDVESTAHLISETANFALTGSIFSQDEDFIKYSIDSFKQSTGNFYVNTKCTGAKVGQQPFGGSRMSGTNDKSGGPYYILRWANMRSVSEVIDPNREVLYPPYE